MSEAIKRGLTAFRFHWPVLFRGWLYFMIASLPVIVSALEDVVKGEVKAIPPGYWWLAGITAVYQGLVAIRAFYDGSAQRHADEIAEQQPPKP